MCAGYELVKAVPAGLSATAIRENQELTMPKQIVHTTAAPASAAYSQATVAGGLVFVSGQGPLDPVSGQVVGASIQEQTRQCLANVRAILGAAGSGLDKVLSATFLLAEEDDFAGMNEEWSRWFQAGPPARHGARLPIRPGGMKISVAVIAEA
jgi:2-iminobutanoate/2-iminopropanoate deaminase